MRFFSTLLASTLGTLIAFGILFFFSLIILIGLMTTSGQPPHIPSGSVLVLPLQGTLPERVSG
ncbi:MAG: signal peptide peptidase SppA, partial [Bacteroidetes bacterium]